MTRKQVEPKTPRSRIPSHIAIEAAKTKLLFVQGQLIAVQPRNLMSFLLRFFHSFLFHFQRSTGEVTF